MDRRSPNSRRPLLALAALTLLAALLAGCGSSSSGTTGARINYAGLEAAPPKAAPPLKLKNYKGEPVSLGDYRGKAVLLTFIYTHCPDVCPLIVSHMKTAQALLGHKAKDLQIVAVSTDPRGDTPHTVAAFLKARGMTGKMQYLIGSRPELEHVWKAWNILAKTDKANPNLVEHSAEIYGIGADGKITTLYPANFKPQELVHDVPLLAQR
ncbi:MAG TPA: SCO family protein [Solirubrobacterales bacterium]